ncbi:hypothetical protein L917_00928 [Phytophthora nicotianae]|uniref:Uncharacterized protein n=2 Tax=Phytophthora nicotianae TaxID=4792 RepID=V9FY43_PHYNI|nr:hypothetical protein F443_01039 [Phytophthora nicotianae P1569]ETM02638.1 hypothetical protein L917_00928 [Phytophthora nicotianae]
MTSTSHAVLVQLRKERRVYEDVMRARCLTSGEDYDTVASAVEDVDDTRLRVEIDNIINSVKNHTLPDIQALFKKNLHLDLKKSDVNERVLQYFMSCDRIIEEHGLQACFDSETGMKEKCSLLVNSSSPEALKEEIKNTLRYQSPEAKTNECKLHDLILAKALDQDREFRRFKRQQTSDDTHIVNQTNHKKQKRHVEADRRGDWKNKSDRRKTDLEHEKRQTTQSLTPKSTATAPDKGCLKCGGPHWCLISLKALKALGAATGKEVPIRELRIPIKGRAIGGHWVKADRAVDLDIQLGTAAGVVEPQQPIECLEI